MNARRAWMLTGLAALIAVPLLATTPSEQLVDEIAELRQQVGGRGQVVADEEFRNALSSQFAKPHYQASPAQDGFQAAAWGQANPVTSGANVYQPFQPASNNQPAAWPTLSSNRIAGPTPENPDPKRLLRESAFELEKIAHRLEMADHCDEADRVRQAAVSLRESAREAGPDRSHAPNLGRQANPIPSSGFSSGVRSLTPNEPPKPADEDE